MLWCAGGGQRTFGSWFSFYLIEANYCFGCSGVLMVGWFMSFWMILLSLMFILLKEHYDSNAPASRIFFLAGVSGD